MRLDRIVQLQLSNKKGTHIEPRNKTGSLPAADSADRDPVLDTLRWRTGYRKGKMKKVDGIAIRDGRVGVYANRAIILGIWVDRPEMVMMTAKM